LLKKNYSSIKEKFTKKQINDYQIELLLIQYILLTHNSYQSTLDTPMDFIVLTLEYDKMIKEFEQEQVEKLNKTKWQKTK